MKAADPKDVWVVIFGLITGVIGLLCAYYLLANAMPVEIDIYSATFIFCSLALAGWFIFIAVTNGQLINKILPKESALRSRSGRQFAQLLAFSPGIVFIFLAKTQSLDTYFPDLVNGPIDIIKMIVLWLFTLVIITSLANAWLLWRLSRRMQTFPYDNPIK